MEATELLEGGPDPLGKGRGGTRLGRGISLSAEVMKEVFAQCMDPGRWGRGGQELEEVGLSEGRGGLCTEGCGFLGHPVKFTAQPGHLIKRGRRWWGWVQLHLLGASEGVREGVIGPAMEQFPSPELFDGLVGGAAKGVAKGRLGGCNVHPNGHPPGDKTSYVASQFRGGGAASPGREDVFSKRAQGSEGRV